MSNKKLPENATKVEGAELARRGRGEISTATAVPHVSYDDLRHADRIVIDGLEVFANHGVYPEENASEVHRFSGALCRPARGGGAR